MIEEPMPQRTFTIGQLVQIAKKCEKSLSVYENKWLGERLHHMSCDRMVCLGHEDDESKVFVSKVLPLIVQNVHNVSESRLLELLTVFKMDMDTTLEISYIWKNYLNYTLSQDAFDAPVNNGK